MMALITLIHREFVTNFIQLVSPQPVDQFSQTKLCWKSSDKEYTKAATND